MNATANTPTETTSQMRERVEREVRRDLEAKGTAPALVEECIAFLRKGLGTMPTRRQFREAAIQLEASGWNHVCSIMADDAQKPGVTNFGQVFTRGGATFYLNFKTIGLVAAAATAAPAPGSCPACLNPRENDGSCYVCDVVDR